MWQTNAKKKKNHDEKNINLLNKKKISITDFFFSFLFGLAWDWSFFISNVAVFIHCEIFALIFIFKKAILKYYLDYRHLGALL